MINCFQFAVFIVFICQLHFSIAGRNEKFLHESNICSHIISYEENVVVPFTDTVKEYRTTWCFAIPPRCTTYTLKTVHLNKTITVNKTKTAFDCCKGYEKVSGSCKPICRRGCNNGECIEPDQCLCNKGWRGPNCNTECEPRRFGRGCENYCSCMHGATCDPQNGFCYCKEGYIGSQCEFPCPNNTYGMHCINKCKCQNGAMCDVKNGSCDCLPGYNGEFCEKPCDVGTHGINCEKTCICLNETTIFCSHTDGKCICKAGYKGNYCGEECDNFTYGIRCENQCDCAKSEGCNHVTGECLCKPGWIGKRCSKKCEVGTFGENCKFKCLPCHNGSGLCNHETGNCECSPGTTGKNCELSAYDHTFDHLWASSPQECNCLNDGICLSITGECICLPGWIGKDCSQSCNPGTYGFNCSAVCTCKPELSCNPVDGMCICMNGSTRSNCEKRSNEELSHTHLHYIGIICSSLVILVICIAIIAYFCFHADEYWHSLFSRKLECTETDRSTNIIMNENFSNPAYEASEFPEIPVADPETQIYAAFEYGKNETEGLQRLKCFINQLTDETMNSENTPDVEHTCHRGSKRKQSALNDVSASSICESSSNTIRKLSKKNIPESSHSSFASSIENNEEYVPEGLCDFYILDDNIYENVRFSKDFQDKHIAK